MVNKNQTAKWLVGRKVQKSNSKYYNIYKKGLVAPVVAFVEENKLSLTLKREFGIKTIADCVEQGYYAKLINNYQI